MFWMISLLLLIPCLRAQNIRQVKKQGRAEDFRIGVVVVTFSTNEARDFFLAPHLTFLVPHLILDFWCAAKES